MNNKIDVELGLDTSAYNKGISDSEKLFQEFQNKINKISPGVDLKKLGNQLLNIKKYMGENAHIDIGDIRLFTEGDVVYAEEIKNNVNEINEDSEEINENIEKTNDELEKENKSVSLISRVFGRLGNQIKRQLYTSVASLLNPINNFKKVFTYLTDTLSPRLGATFKNIGNNLLEYFASSPVFQNLIHDALYFIYLLQTIYNSIAKIFQWREIDLFKKSVKTQKELNKQLNKSVAGFDEINDIGSSEGNGSDAVPMSAGELFSSEELENAANLAQKIADKIQEIKANWQGWIIKVALVVAAFFILKSLIGGIFGKGALLKGVGEMASGFGKAAEAIAILGGLSLVIDSITNFIKTISETGMSSSDALKLIGLALLEVAGAFTIIMAELALFKSIDFTTILAAFVVFEGLASVLNGVANVLKQCTKNGTNLSDVGTLLGTVTLALVALMGAIVLLGPEMTAGLIPFSILMIEIQATLAVMALTIPTILDALGKFATELAPIIIKILETIGKYIVEIIYGLGDVLPPIIESVGNLFNKIFSGISQVVKAVGDVIVKILKTVDETVGNVLDHILNFIERLGPAVNTLVDNIIAAVTKVINFFVSGMEYLINTIIIKPINSLIKKVSSGAISELLDWAGIGKLKTISTISIDRFNPKLATGTNYVPRDMTAQIHKGEAVIPKKFNDREFFGGGNEETNVLLETLIQRVDNIEFNPYIGVKDIGEASINYINKKSRMTGRSMIG